jgi:hypothetical protein
MSSATMTRHRPRPAAHRTATGAVRLVMAAQRALNDAAATDDPLERYAGAHLAALRAAAAVLADRTPPGAKPRRPTSAWTLLIAVAPDLEPWAGYFAAGASTRSAAEAGLRGAASPEQADRLVQDATAFIAVVETMLGLLSPGEVYPCSNPDTGPNAVAAGRSRQ